MNRYEFINASLTFSQNWNYEFPMVQFLSFAICIIEPISRWCQYLSDYGKRGQILSIPRQIALKELLLPQLAVYASPENLEVYKDIAIPEESIQYSSDIVRKVSVEFNNF